MIISDRHRYLFVEVPHTATTAISKELREKYDGRKILGKHSTYSEFRRRASRDERSYFVFAGVRNPLDIVVTDYSKYLSNHKDTFTARERRTNWVTPEHLERFDFVQTHQSFEKFLLRFYRSTYNNWFLTGYQRFGSILRFESVQDDFSRTLRDLGIRQNGPLPMVNKSARENGFEDMYETERSRRHAAKIFGPFMRQWGYAFPESWGIRGVPVGSLLAYGAKCRVGSIVADHLRVSGSSRLGRWIQRIADQVT